MDLNSTDRAVHTLQPTGNLDSLNGTRLHHDVEALIQAGARTVLVDCAHLELIDSAGFSALAASLKALQTVDGNLILCHLHEQHQRLLSLTGLDAVLTVL